MIHLAKGHPDSLPNGKHSVRLKLKALADDKVNVIIRLKFALERVENIVGKMRKCWLPAFSPFPTMFSEGYFFRVVKIRDCVVKS